jgi:hypothetical protein
VGVLPDELVDRICPPPQPAGEPPAWLVAHAQVIAEATVAKLRPLIRTKVHAALNAEARKRGVAESLAGYSRAPASALGMRSVTTRR